MLSDWTGNSVYMGDSGMLEVDDEDIGHLDEQKTAYTQYLKINDQLLSLISQTEVSQLSTLRHLNLHIRDDSYPKIKIIDNLHSCFNLLSLNLSYNNIEKIENLHVLPNLRNLNLSENFIEKVENIHTLMYLEKLNLSGNNISVLSNNVTDNPFENNRALIHLRLSRNEISDCHTFTHLQVLPNLQVLKIDDNPVYQQQQDSNDKNGSINVEDIVISSCVNLVQLNDVSINNNMRAQVFTRMKMDRGSHDTRGKEGVSFDLSPRGSIDTGASDKENEPLQLFSAQSTSMSRKVLGELTSPNVLSSLAPTFDDVRGVLKPLSDNRSPASTLASSNSNALTPTFNTSPHSLESSRSSPHSSMMKTALPERPVRRAMLHGHEAKALYSTDSDTSRLNHSVEYLDTVDTPSSRLVSSVQTPVSTIDHHTSGINSSNMKSINANSSINETVAQSIQRSTQFKGANVVAKEMLAMGDKVELLANRLVESENMLALSRQREAELKQEVHRLQQAAIDIDMDNDKERREMDTTAASNTSAEEAEELSFLRSQVRHHKTLVSAHEHLAEQLSSSQKQNESLALEYNELQSKYQQLQAQQQSEMTESQRVSTKKLDSQASVITQLENSINERDGTIDAQRRDVMRLENDIVNMSSELTAMKNASQQLALQYQKTQESLATQWSLEKESLMMEKDNEIAGYRDAKDRANKLLLELKESIKKKDKDVEDITSSLTSSNSIIKQQAQQLNEMEALQLQTQQDVESVMKQVVKKEKQMEKELAVETEHRNMLQNQLDALLPALATMEQGSPSDSSECDDDSITYNANTLPLSALEMAAAESVAALLFKEMKQSPFHSDSSKEENNSPASQVVSPLGTRHLQDACVQAALKLQLLIRKNNKTNGRDETECSSIDTVSLSNLVVRMRASVQILDNSEILEATQKQQQEDIKVLNTRIEGLQGEIYDKSKQLKELEHSCNDVRYRKEEIESQMASLLTQVDTAKRELSTYSNDNEMLRRECEGLKKETVLSSKQLDIENNSLHRCLERKRGLESDLKDLQSQFDSKKGYLSDEEAALKQSIVLRTQDLNKISDNIRDQSQQLQVLKREYNEMKTSQLDMSNGFISQRREHEKRLEHLTQSIDREKALLVSVRSDLRQTHIEMDRYTTCKKELESEVHNVQSALYTLQSDKNTEEREFKRSKDAHMSEKTHLESQLYILRSDVQNQRNEANELVHSINIKREELKVLQQEISVKQKEAREALLRNEKTVSTSVEQARDASQLCKQKQEEHEALVRKCVEQQSEYDSIMIQINQRQQELRSKKDEIASLDIQCKEAVRVLKENENRTIESSTQLREVVNDISRHTEECKTVSSRLLSYQKEERDIKQSISQLKIEYSSLVQQINDKQRVCEDVRISLESLHRELNTIQNNKSKLENDISRLEKEKSYCLEMTQGYEAKRMNAEIRLNHFQESIENTSRDLDMMQRRLNEQSKREEEGKTKCKELLGQQDKLTNELHRLKESKNGEERCIIQRKEDLELLELSRERIKKELVECQQDKQGLIIELEKLRLQTDNASKDYEHIINEMRERQSTLEILQGQVSDAKLSLNAMKKDCLLKESDYHLICQQYADEETKLKLYVGRMQEIQQLIYTAEQGYQDFKQECFSQQKQAIYEIDNLQSWPKEVRQEVQSSPGNENDKNRISEVRSHASAVYANNSDSDEGQAQDKITAVTMSQPTIACDSVEDAWAASTKGMMNLKMVVDRLRSQSRGVLQELDAHKSN